MSTLLVVAGEASGDAWAADVVRRLGARSFGFGGARLRAAGTELLGDLRDWSAMGLGSVLRRAPALARGAWSLWQGARARRPRAALLVGFSEWNSRLAPRLRQSGVHVLWYAPPQVWAWRPGRARRLGRAADRLAVVLPFEAPVWASAGAVVDYVGHPALEHPAPPPRDASGRSRLLLLPGSRRQEVRAHLLPLLSAGAALRRSGDVTGCTLVLSPSLDPDTAAWALRHAERAGTPAGDSLSSAAQQASSALVGSGTATLECALLGVPPVIVYRTDPLTYVAARQLVRVPHIGLPNLVLGRRAFPELVQHRLTADGASAAVRGVLAARAAHLESCAEVRERLQHGAPSCSAAESVAGMLAPWLS